MIKIITRQTANFFLTNDFKCDTIITTKGKELIQMTRDLWIIAITLLAPLFVILVGQIVINCME